MDRWSLLVPVISGASSIIGFIAVFVKMGREKGVADTEMREMRKDVDKNAVDINSLWAKVSQMQIENTRLISTLSSDLGWIKASLSDIKTKMDRE